MGVGLLAVVGACGFSTRVDLDAAVVIPDAPPGAWLAGFQYRKPIAVSRTGTSTLQNFPVGVVLASDADLAAHARADGRDIVVTTGDAMTLVDSELVAFAPGNGALELWTRVPSLPTGTTILYLYYGGATTSTNAAGVFPSERFKGVWHLSDANPAAAADSTPGAHVLASAGTAIPTSQQGVAGAARGHDGVDDTLQIADPADGSLDVGTQSFAYSLWINEVGTVGMFDTPLFKGGTSPGNPGYCILTGSTLPWLGKLHDATTYVEIPLTTGTTLAQWLHFVIVVDRSVAPAKGRGFVNGAMTSEVNVGLGSLETIRDLSLGSGSGGALYHGAIDEVRIYNTALTADWIATEYANLATPGFLTKGGEEPKP